ncbi:hypothetical protein L1987_76717 [Smallanthus sonchifolius]|uniref:Uncharacterized protein n=1 Tax=Smallanthus sonchifolius TaxID=185202 RepID=A0ACB8Z909_9ASTR|nr:hypothetical protein L1987_76717 [Smallanthus sonchifolius]
MNTNFGCYLQDTSTSASKRLKKNLKTIPLHQFPFLGSRSPGSICARVRIQLHISYSAVDQRFISFHLLCKIKTNQKPQFDLIEWVALLEKSTSVQIGGLVL